MEQFTEEQKKRQQRKVWYRHTSKKYENKIKCKKKIRLNEWVKKYDLIKLQSTSKWIWV